MDMDKLTGMEMLSIEHSGIHEFYNCRLDWDEFASTLAEALASDEEVGATLVDMVRNGLLNVSFTEEARALNRQVAKWREESEHDPVEDAMNALNDTEELVLLSMVDDYDEGPWRLEWMKEELSDCLGEPPLDEGGTPLYSMEDVLDRFRSLGIVSEGEEFVVTEFGKDVRRMILDIDESDAYFRMQKECRP